MTDTSAEAVERELSLLACRRAGAALWAERTEGLIRALVSERDAARGDVALLQDAWATLHNALNCIIHEGDNDPPDVQNAIRIARAGLDEARDLWPRVAADDDDAITAEDEDRAFLGHSDEDDDE